MLFLTLLALLASTTAKRLAVSGRDLIYGDEKVYLNGCNIAWHNYAYDFGNGVYDGTLETWVQEIGSAGGNSIRIWVHEEGDNTPNYDDNGFVTACDRTGDFENDVLSLLDAAQANNVLVDLCMWTGAGMRNQKTEDMIYDDAKLDSYIENCLTPLMEKIKGHPALGSYEAMNEPEGLVKVETNSDPCYDTTNMDYHGAGWAGNNIPMERLLRFIGRQNQAVHSIDPQTLTTIGSSQVYQNDVFPVTHNYYSDECLNQAAGGSGAGIDFYQMHTYDWQGAWITGDPFTVLPSDYNLDKPILIGEFSSACSAGTPLEDLLDYAYTEGYTGTWTWHYAATGDCSETREHQLEGLQYMSDRTDHGVIDFIVE
ncbi:mannan endo-1,4-beta-mannosidase [Procambarus clarkii]|uniref:mannan endo-1,4-beta-mannosidase n=1 Tax=Procambarus clarkii TaxID=6728 RepID=UPI001E6769BF|nr:mannan endo-1,4-beta-mannosidase-like [Procambarus clarkii]